MLVLVLSDIHGNFEALKAVIEESKKYKWKELWFLGDLAGYGPRPQECYELLRTYRTTLIPGNHDAYLAGKLSGSYFSDHSLQSLIMGRGLLKQSTLRIIKELPQKQERNGITLVHGSPIDPITDYIISDDDAWESFKAFKGSCCVFGHTHVQGFYKLEKNEMESRRAEHGEIISYRKSRLLFNPGSVGQPRDGNPKAAWSLLDTRKKEVRFFRTSYDIEATQRDMQKQHASEFLIERLEKGI